MLFFRFTLFEIMVFFSLTYTSLTRLEKKTFIQSDNIYFLLIQSFKGLYEQYIMSYSKFLIRSSVVSFDNNIFNL